MHDILKRKSCIGIILISVFIFLIPGCSEKIINTNSGDDVRVTISTKLTSGMEISALTLFLLTVTGPDIDRPIIDTMIVENHLLIARVEVPAGKGRTFKIEAYDDTGRLIYVGTARTDVTPDVELELDIALKPYVPLIKLSPRFKSIHQNSQVVLELRVYNIRDLDSVDFLLQYSSPTDPYFYIDSIVPNINVNSFIKLDTLPPDTLQQNEFAFTIYESVHTNVLGIVDSSGYARLAFIYASNYSTGNMYDTVSLTIEATAMSNTADASIMPNIYYEGCTIEYYDPYSFQIAYWAMDNDPLDTMYDRSQNNLFGLAYGTSIFSGYSGTARFFDGNNAYIEVPDTDLLDINTEISIDMWIQINILEGEGIIISKMGSEGQINYQIRCTVSNLLAEETLSFEFGSSTLNAYQVKKFIRDDKWHHIVISFAFGNPSSIYWLIDDQIIDGKWASGDGRIIPEANDGNLQIGREILFDPHYYYGGLDEIRIYNKAMEPSFFTRPIGR